MAGAVIIAFVYMQTYIRRGIQATVKVAADQMGSQADSEEDADYGQSSSSSNTTMGSSTYNTTTSGGGNQATTFNSSTVTNGTSTTTQYAD
ncbi:hypothetical protein EPO66_04500 [bacterium]|nr:MAG: hypothetical protein EPO66_04500 [bacterium]